jgi:hypothetical protein
MKQLVHRGMSIAAAFALVAGLATTAHADAFKQDPADAPVGTTLVALNELSETPGNSVRMMTPAGESHTDHSVLCDEGVTDSGPCSASGNGFFYAQQVLPYCLSEAQENCVESLKFGKSGADLVPANHVRDIVGQTYPVEDPIRGLYPAGTTTLWEAPGLLNQGGTASYAVQVTTAIGFDNHSQKYYTFATQAGILPYKEKSGKYKASKLRMDTNRDGEKGIFGWADTKGCAFTEDGVCGAVQNFAPDSRFELSYRVSNQITGWFRGRIQSPNVTISNFSARNNRITMTASPVSVPRLGFLATAENTSPKGLAFMADSNRTGYIEPFKGDTIRSISPDSENAIAWIEEFRKAANDTAAGISTLWNFGTMDRGQNDLCFQDKTRVIGVVTTNATALSPGTPDFNNGLLTYKVAGLHYAPDGKTLNEGSYDLVMRSDVARCLYGFSKAPLSATVSVIGEGGENKVATTVVSEKDGWLKLAAYGFTFSSPTISVKLSQAAAPAKKTTITCAKGKLTKKVTAVGPKCPAGYKKK